MENSIQTYSPCVMLRGALCPEASLPRLVRDPSVAKSTRSLRVTYGCAYQKPLVPRCATTRSPCARPARVTGSKTAGFIRLPAEAITLHLYHVVPQKCSGWSGARGVEGSAWPGPDISNTPIQNPMNPGKNCSGT